MSRPGPQERGDSAAAPFERARPQLFRIAYRMLGSVSEAEDVLQDAYLRWHPVDRAAVSNPTAFLVRLVTRLCLDALKSARSRRVEYVGPWLPEPLVSEPLSDRAEDPSEMADVASEVSMAFLLLLERLTPVERAVFLLRESFDFSYAEIAKVVGKSAAACRQIGHRARERLADAGGRSKPADPREHDVLTRRFLKAAREGDVEALIEVLDPHAVAWADGGGAAPAARRPVKGASNVARYITGLAAHAPRDAEFRVATVNGLTGLLTYVGGRLHNVLSLRVEAGRIQEVYIVVNPEKLRHAGRAGARSR